MKTSKKIKIFSFEKVCLIAIILQSIPMNALFFIFKFELEVLYYGTNEYSRRKY